GLVAHARMSLCLSQFVSGATGRAERGADVDAGSPSTAFGGTLPRKHWHDAQPGFRRLDKTPGQHRGQTMRAPRRGGSFCGFERLFRSGDEGEKLDVPALAGRII